MLRPITPRAFAGRLEVALKFLLYFALPLVLVACGTMPTVKPETASTKSLTPELQTLLELVNAERAKGHTCGDKVFEPAQPLTISAKLVLAAQKHSTDLEVVSAKTSMHVTPEGAVNYTPGMSFTQRVDAEGYAWSALGENVAYGFGTPELVLKAWLESPGHCTNIMSPKYKELGLGKAGNGNTSYWTQDFATPL
jgi:uncharacterized protein YkwD